MKLFTLYITSLTLLHSLIYAAIVPKLAPRNLTIAKRGGEVNYLANCQRISLSTGLDYHASYMTWYADVDRSLHGPNLRPDSMSNEYRDWSKGGDYLHWEGQQQDIYFSDSGVTVQTHIDADAQSRDFTAWAGWALRTSDWRAFDCFKDNGRQLFYWNPPVPDGTDRVISCEAIYWCV
ncbi:hypothetical protein FS837_010156 [Tulasnella sp. UAMH 9824]|nr:hypothetical protein FS837_010156 [Tulasnella sp. UAMH 9824]